jgi:hypothetical protein
MRENECGDETKGMEMEMSPTSSAALQLSTPQSTRNTEKLPWKDIWTRSVIFIMITEAFYDLHMGYINFLLT